MPRLGRGNPTTSFILEDEEEDEPSTNNFDYTQTQLGLTQVDADQSQFIDAEKGAERKKLNALNPTARNQVITDLSRILLFKALGGETIDRTKCITQALGENLKKERVGGALLQDANDRLKKVFGFEARRVPEKMEEDLPSKFKNRLYLINNIADDDHGTHSTNIHSQHVETMADKGVLMMILAFAFCKGTAQVRSGQMKGAGKKTRWITEHHLYNLLHRVDENIPSEPPSVEGKKKSRQSGGRKSLGTPVDEGGVGETPDIDALLERFVSLDYILRDKIEEPGDSAFAGEDGKVLAYAMGPRAAMEIGRKQIIYFCSGILDEQPCPTMLQEIDEDEEGEESEEEEEEEVEVEKTKKKRRKKMNIV